MGRISALTELTTLASNDYLIVLDSSANIAKKITVANAFGIPDFGWTATGETWTYSSWSSTTRIGVITVPTDATTKYTAGMRVRISQTTGGTKYGIIQKVAATELSIFFPSGTTLNNETISTPYYSPLYAPSGINLDPSLWTLEATLSSNATTNSPTASVFYNALSLTIGVGTWEVDFEATEWIVKGAATIVWGFLCLSDANNSNSDKEMSAMLYGQYSEGMEFIKRAKTFTFASQTTKYLNYGVDNASVTQVSVYSSTAAQQIAKIRARCAFI